MGVLGRFSFILRLFETNVCPKPKRSGTLKSVYCLGGAVDPYYKASALLTVSLI